MSNCSIILKKGKLWVPVWWEDAGRLIHLHLWFPFNWITILISGLCGVGSGAQCKSRNSFEKLFCESVECLGRKLLCNTRKWHDMKNQGNFPIVDFPSVKFSSFGMTLATPKLHAWPHLLMTPIIGTGMILGDQVPILQFLRCPQNNWQKFLIVRFICR